MIGEMLLESNDLGNSRRRWTTVLSLAVQCIAVAIAIAIPLLTTDALSARSAPSSPVYIPPQPIQITEIVPIRTSPSAGGGTPQLQIRNNRTSVPTQSFRTPADDAVAIPLASEFALNSSLPVETTGPSRSTVKGPSSTFGTSDHQTSTPYPVSHFAPGQLIRQIKPLYPVPARMARIQGAVVLVAIISREGTIESLRVTRGNPMLAPAALDAVRQWRYRPYILNGQAVEVETEVTVNFTLGSS